MDKRAKSFIWRWGAFVIIAVGAYTMNIADIRSIDVWKLATIFTTVTMTYLVNEATKFLNGSKPE